MSAIYTQPNDTRVALLIATQLLARAVERGCIDDPIEHEFIDMVDISILPAVRVAHYWSAVEPYGGPHRPLIHITLVIIGQAIEVYTARALALLPPQLVAQGRALVTTENHRCLDDPGVDHVAAIGAENAGRWMAGNGNIRANQNGGR